MRSPTRQSLRTILTFLILAGLVAMSSQAQTRSVIINQVRLSDDVVLQLEQRYRVPIRDGNYWYDRKSGAWGVSGGPTVGFIIPNLDIGGPLRADAPMATPGCSSTAASCTR
jgi:hypothetical protein